MAVEIAEAYVSLVPSGKDFASKVAQELGGPLEGAGKNAGDKVSSGIFDGLGAKAGKAGIVAGTALGVGIAGAGAGLFALGATFDDAFDAIRVQTGATGDALGGLTDSFKTVFSDVPASSGDAALAIGTLNQKLGLTGAPLEALSEQMLNLSRVTGTDLATNLASAVDVFNSFGISAADQPAKLDELFRASQATGVGVDSLAATMANAGPNLQQLGLSFEQSAGLVGIFGKAGVDVGAVLPALSKSIVAAAKDGKNAGDVFRGTFDAIKNAPDDTAAAGAAIDVFGAKAGPKLAGLIRQGKLGFDELATSISSGGDTINGAADDTADLAEKFGTFKNKVLVGLEPIASGVFSALGDGFERLVPLVGPVISEITGGFAAFFSAFKAGDGDVTSSGFPGFMEKLANGARSVFDVISQIDFGELFGNAKEILTPVVDSLFQLGGTTFELLKASLTTIIQLFKDNRETILGVLDAVKSGLTGAIDGLNVVFGFLATHMELVKAIAIPLTAAFVAYKTVTTAISLATKIWTGVQAAFNAVMALNPVVLVAAAIAGLVVGVIYAYTHFETFRNIVDGFFDVIQGAFNWIVEHWQLVLGILTGPVGAAALIIINNWDTIKAVFTGMFDWIRDHWQLIVEILTGPVGIAVGLIVGHWDTIKSTFAAVKDWIGARIDDVVGFFSALPGRIAGFIASAWSTITSSFTSAASWVGGTVDTIVSFFVSLPGRILSAIGDATQLLIQKGRDIAGSLLSGIASGLQAGFDFAGTIVGNISGAIRGAINSVIGELNRAIPNHFGWGPVGFDIPADPIPYLAKGGIVTRATLAVIGEAGPEAVIPLGGAGVSAGLGPTSGRGQFRDLIINTRTDASAEKIAREVRWAQLTAGV